MRKSDIQKTFEKFIINIFWDWEFLDRIQSARRVVRTVYEKRSVFETYVFSICASWEILVEDLFIDCLNKDTSAYKEHTGFEISKDLSRETCKAILCGIRYIEFRGIEELQGVANNILVANYNPFKAIPSKNVKKIGDFYKLRNYLAHYSDFSRRQLLRIYKNRYRLRTFRQPGEFLLARPRGQPTTRMDDFINNFIDTANIMARSLGIDIF